MEERGKESERARNKEYAPKNSSLCAYVDRVRGTIRDMAFGKQKREGRAFMCVWSMCAAN